MRDLIISVVNLNPSKAPLENPDPLGVVGMRSKYLDVWDVVQDNPSLTADCAKVDRRLRGGVSPHRCAKLQELEVGEVGEGRHFRAKAYISCS